MSRLPARRGRVARGSQAKHVPHQADDPSREDKSATPGRFVIDPEKVVDRHLWQDKHLMHQVHFVSDRFRDACERVGIEGLGFKSIAETDWLALARDAAS